MFTATRREEVAGIRVKFPGKIPVRPLSWGMGVRVRAGIWGRGAVRAYSLKHQDPANDLLLSSPSSSDIEKGGVSFDICFRGDSG